MIRGNRARTCENQDHAAIHNHANFMPRALSALPDQELPLSEIIVIDDSSTDSSGDVAESFRVRLELWTKLCLVRRRLMEALTRPLNHGLA
jgi:cellulose synthase/poly-beta-1,6-N-acetylglucosamine synthase-like glycosyltransferase